MVIVLPYPPAAGESYCEHWRDNVFIAHRPTVYARRVRKIKIPHAKYREFTMYVCPPYYGGEKPAHAAARVLALLARRGILADVTTFRIVSDAPTTGGRVELWL